MVVIFLVKIIFLHGTTLVRQGGENDGTIEITKREVPGGFLFLLFFVIFFFTSVFFTRCVATLNATFFFLSSVHQC